MSSRNVKSRNFGTGPPASESGLDLYEVKTPNGLKINVALEELKDLGLLIKWTEHLIDFGKNEQKEPWFLQINPNGRIPAIIDRDRNDQRVWESGSILLYLSKHYDKEFLLHFEDEAEETEMWSWVFFQHGGLGPMQGQAGHFLNAAPVQDKYAARRYIEETRRLLSIYEDRLNEDGKDGSKREYLAGAGKGKFSYMRCAFLPFFPGEETTSRLTFSPLHRPTSCASSRSLSPLCPPQLTLTHFPAQVSFTWARVHPLSLGLPSLTNNEHGFSFPAVAAWIDRIAARPGTKRALEGNGVDKLRGEEGWEEKVREKARWVWEEDGEKGEDGRKRDEL